MSFGAGVAMLLTAITAVPGVTPASTRGAQGAEQPTRPSSCLNLPVSSLTVRPTSCWVTGPTSMVVAGTDPQSPGDGVVVVVDQQSRKGTIVPGGGALHISAIANGQACVVTANGHRVGVDEATGAVTDSCRGSAVFGQVSRPITGTQPSTTPSTAPEPSISYYVFASYIDVCGVTATTGCPLYNLGVDAPVPPTGGMVILDVGAPCFDPNTLVYGTQLFISQSCTPDSQLVTLVQAYIRGYETNANRSTSTPFVIAAGTSNSLTAAVPGNVLSPSQTAAHGQAWFNSVVKPLSSSVLGLAAPVTVWAGSDTEESSDGNWYDAAPSRAWIDGYSAAAGAAKPCVASTTGLSVDYGDYVPSEPGWTPADVYHVAWGAPAACAVPEIYYSANATEWQSLNQWAAGAGQPLISFVGVLSENQANGSLTAAGSWNALQSATGQSAPYLSVIGSSGGPGAQAPDAPSNVRAVAGAASATVAWSAPAWDGGLKITGYTVTAWTGATAVKSMTLSGWPVPETAVVTGLANGTAYTFTVSATNAVGSGPSSISSAVTPSELKPYTLTSTAQYHLTGSNGTAWMDIDAQALSLTIQPSASGQAVITANADMWTDTAGVNQDLGVAVNDTIVGWKESGGLAGTFSPNAATLHVVYPVTGGTTYTIKLRWKANKPAGGGTIYSGAGPIGGKYSPTLLTVRLVPAAASLSSAVVTTQPALTNSNGTTWQDIDTQHLTLNYLAPATGTVVVTGNADLWTATAGYNQDIAVAVGGSVVAWKESGGQAGAFSPNAALVEAAIPVTAGSTYTIGLKWKANHNAPGVTIYAGAGPIGGQYSPTRLTVRFVGASVNTAVSTKQYRLTSSDGSTWTAVDSTTFSIPATAGCLAVVSANADLWTMSSGYNEDLAIAISSLDAVAYPNGLVVWKESGGSAAFSPNAAYAHAVIGLPAGGPYTVTLLWKTNRPDPSSIFAAAGSSGNYSPTSLTVELYC